jgi:hypothetical protein
MKKRCSLTYKRIVRNISHETVRRQWGNCC